MVDKDPQAHITRSAWLALQIIGAGLIVALAAYSPIISGTAHARSDPAPSMAPSPAAAAVLTPTEKMLVASDGAANDAFGYSVGADGDLIIAGAYAHQIGVNADQGAAYLFARNQGGAGNWGQLKVLTATDGAFGDRFGQAVAVGGDYALVGAPMAMVASCCVQGAAYLFSRNQGGAGNWGLVKKLVAPGGEAYDELGTAVAIYGDFAVVGAPLRNVGANTSQGAAYVFARNQGGSDNWGFVKQLTASHGATNDWFGAAVAVNGDTIVVGINTVQGAAYVFARNQGGANNWGEVKMLTPSDPETGDGFGATVGVYSGTAVVGAWLHTVVSNTTQGAVYVYERDQGGVGNWGETRRLVASDGAVDDNLGVAVSISGDRIAAGAPYDDGAQIDQGAVYVFERNRGGAGNWGQAVKLTASNGNAGDRLGSAVAVNSATVVGGAWLRDVGLNADQGAAYAFEVGATQNLYLPAILR